MERGWVHTYLMTGFNPRAATDRRATRRMGKQDPQGDRFNPRAATDRRVTRTGYQ